MGDLTHTHMDWWVFCQAEKEQKHRQRAEVVGAQGILSPF